MASRWLFGLVVLIGGLVFMLGLGRTSADGTPVAQEIHPLVGSWDVEIDWVSTPTERVLVTFAADGTVIATDAEGATWHGAWTATGPRTADYRYVSLPTAKLPLGATFYGHAEVEASGETFVRSTRISGGIAVRGERITPR